MLRFHVPLLFLLWLACNASFAQPPAVNYSIAPTYGYTYSEQMIEGGDGYKLFTRIYLPEGEGPWPLVMTRTPYGFGNTSGDNLMGGQEYARRGMGYVLQYCRGKGGSEGTYKPNEYEREDGLALVNWLANQKWCRSIGIFGTSYMAFTGWILADSLPEKVKGLYLSHYGVDRFVSLYRDGLFRQDIMTGWAIDNAEELTERPYRDRENPYYEIYRYMPQVEMDVNMLGAELPWYRDWITNTSYNDPYWNQGFWAQLKAIPQKVTIPVTIVAGLYDHHLEGTLLGYERLNEETRKNSRLILGSWNHSMQVTPTHHDPQHARDVVIDEDQFEWLYSVVAEGIIPKGEVKAYIIEEDKWITMDEWPILAEDYQTWYFSAEKDPANEKAFVMSRKSPALGKEISYDYDPQDPVISNGGATLFTSGNRRGSRLQEEPGFRDDVITFMGPVLDKDLALAGKISVRLTVSTDGDDTSFAIKISEVMPDGSAYNIRNGITTLAYRNDPLGDRQTYNPDEVVEITIETLPVTWNVKAGNRIRVDVTSSNFPEYSIHSNYAGVWSLQTETRIARQTLYMGGSYESSITFPVIYLTNADL